MTHICVSNLTIIVSDNGLSPGRRQAIIWTNAGILLIWPLGANFSEILIEMLTFSFKKMRWKVSFVKRRPFCPGLNVVKFCLCYFSYNSSSDKVWMLKSLLTCHMALCRLLLSLMTLSIWSTNILIENIIFVGPCQLLAEYLYQLHNLTYE